MVKLYMENNDDGKTVVKMSSQDSKNDLIFFLPEDFSQEPKDRFTIHINKTKNLLVVKTQCNALTGCY